MLTFSRMGVSTLRVRAVPSQRDPPSAMARTSILFAETGLSSLATRVATQLKCHSLSSQRHRRTTTIHHLQIYTTSKRQTNPWAIVLSAWRVSM